MNKVGWLIFFWLFCFFEQGKGSEAQSGLWLCASSLAFSSVGETGNYAYALPVGSYDGYSDATVRTWTQVMLALGPGVVTPKSFLGTAHREGMKEEEAQRVLEQFNGTESRLFCLALYMMGESVETAIHVAQALKTNADRVFFIQVLYRGRHHIEALRLVYELRETWQRSAWLQLVPYGLSIDESLDLITKHPATQMIRIQPKDSTASSN